MNKEKSMQKFGKFTRHMPASDADVAHSLYVGIAFLADDAGNKTEKPSAIDGRKVAYLQDEKGNDWYDVRHLFNKYDTLKIGYADDGRVLHFTTNIDAFFPNGLSVIELEPTEDNMRVSLSDDWFYKDGKLQQIRDYVVIATAERDSLMSEAADAIAPLQDAADVDLATDEELQRLKAWKTYRVMLSRLDLSTAPGIKWPIKPE